VASATVWRPPDHVSATHRVGSAIQAVVAEPGVMEAQADTVEISVKADRPVIVAVGRDTDVTAWLADSPAEHLTGFAGRHTFKVRESGSDEPLAAAAGSDLWVVEREYSSGGRVKWQKADEGRWSLVVAPVASGGEDGAVALGDLQVTMTWPQVVSTPFLWPGVTVGVILLALGAVGLVAARRRSEAERPDQAAAEAAVQGATADRETPPGAEPDGAEPDAALPLTTGEPVVVGVASAVVELAAAEAEPEGGLSVPVAMAPAVAGAEAGSDQTASGESGTAAALEPAAGTGATGARGAPGEPGQTGPDQSGPDQSGPDQRPAKPKRRWFRRRTEPAAVEQPPEPPPAPSPEPKLDLGLATPNRNWERLASPDPRYAELAEAEIAARDGRPLSSGPAADSTQMRPGAPGADREWASDQPTQPGSRPQGSLWDRHGGGETTAPQAPGAPSGGVAGAPARFGRPVGPIGAATDGQTGPGLIDLPETAESYQPTAAPSRFGLPQRQAGAGPAITADQKIAALRRSHTSVADEAAETIAAAMAAATGSGSAAGLTRRQIREAERAAAEALHVTARSTGEIPVRQESARSQVQMQSSEGSGQ
jgi:hypothetical protein